MKRVRYKNNIYWIDDKGNAFKTAIHAFFGIASPSLMAEVEPMRKAEKITGLCGIEAFCTANAIKYLWRWKVKNGVEDLEKAKWYIDRLIERLEESEQ